MEKILLPIGYLYGAISFISYFWFLYVDFNVHGFMYFMFLSSWVDTIKATLWPITYAAYHFNNTQAYGILW